MDFSLHLFTSISTSGANLRQVLSGLEGRGAHLEKAQVADHAVFQDLHPEAEIDSAGLHGLL